MSNFVKTISIDENGNEFVEQIEKILYSSVNSTNIASAKNVVSDSGTNEIIQPNQTGNKQINKKKFIPKFRK